MNLLNDDNECVNLKVPAHLASEMGGIRLMNRTDTKFVTFISNFQQYSNHLNVILYIEQFYSPGDYR